jgi:hypothetical protein
VIETYSPSVLSNPFHSSQFRRRPSGDAHDQSTAVLVAALLDRSGSTYSIADDTRGGFDSFIIKEREADCLTMVTLAQFDDRYELVYDSTPIEGANPLVLDPRGMDEFCCAEADPRQSIACAGEESDGEGARRVVIRSNESTSCNETFRPSGPIPTKHHFDQRTRTP